MHSAGFSKSIYKNTLEGSWTQVGGLEFQGYSGSYYVFFPLGLSDSGGQVS